MRRIVSALLAVLFITAAYVFAWPSANIVYFAGVILHVLGGVVLLLLLPFLLRKILRDTTSTGRAGWIILVVGGLLGAALIFTGTRRHEWPLVAAHIVACAAGGALLASVWAGNRGFLSSSNLAAAFRSIIVLTAAALALGGAWWLRTVPWERAHNIKNPSISPETMDDEGDGPHGPFFPSSAQTADGKRIPASYFTESKACERCHQDIYKQWQGSAHHFSSFNNAWYRKSIEYMQDTVGIKPSKWCAGCHDPALLFSGMFDRPIREVEDTPAGQAGLGCMMCHSFVKVKSSMGQGDYELEYPALHRLASSSNPLVRRLHDYLTELNPEPHRRVFLKPFMRDQTAQFCSTCHKVHLDVPVNHYRWTRGFNEYDNWQASGVSGEGARSFYYPAKPQMCADCHMPLVESKDAGNFLPKGESLRDILLGSFGKSETGFVHSHSFPAANTAIPYVNGDSAQLNQTENFLKDHEVSVDIFAISPESAAKTTGAAPSALPSGPGFETTFAVGEEAESSVPAHTSSESATPAALLTAPLNRVAASVRRSGTYRVDVVVRTRRVGHFFPGGTVDAFDCWLELEATDDKGRAIFSSGLVADNGKGPVDPGAHFYRSLQIDAHGNPINKRNTWATRAVVYVHLIPPGAADTVHYRLHIPKDAGDHVHLQARLNYRKFSWWNTQFSFTGEHDPLQQKPGVSPGFDDSRYLFAGDPSKIPGGSHGVPNPPIVVVAENEASLRVLPSNAKEPAADVAKNRDDWTRWNDYGIGLFPQGDLTGAAVAFEKITEIDPDNPDGWVNVGRVRVQEGNLTEATRVLERAISLSPHLARAHFFYAKALRNQGHIDEAIPHLREVLAQYPHDRVVHNDLGRIFFLKRNYAAAIEEFQSTLSIDPEDLEANYNLMLCYTGLNQPDRAAEFQKRYLRFKADESAQTLTGPYLRSHAEDNLERQPIHEHVSALAEKPSPKKYAAEAHAGKESD